jgi:ABC-2 type transport system ATP-binding protein
MNDAATAPDREDVALELSNVRYTYPARGRREPERALRGVCLAISAGETVALLGPNGSGKSTLIRIICGLQRADEGSVLIAGAADLAAARRRLGVVFQTPSLDPDLTVLENLRNQAVLYDLPRNERRARIEEEMEAAEISDRADARVRTLSGGLQRRADLCRALLHRPPVVLLDEPTVGLDPAARASFLQRLHDRQRRDGLTILFSTHLTDEAERMDRVVLMHEGSIVADDAPAALRRTVGERRIVVHDPAWRPPADQSWQRGVDQTWRLALDGRTDSITDIVTDLARSAVPFSVVPPTLADVFETLTGGRLEPLEGRRVE